MMRESQVEFLNTLPNKIDFENSVLIYDQILEKKFKKWISKFPRKLKVRSGESLKTFRSFSVCTEKVLNLTAGVSREKIEIVSLGGGTVGDFSGFIASVLKRGVFLTHIPSTWLSAMDSAHGGKTALNSAKSKNQIGTFYPAHKIFVVKEVLLSQPEQRAEEVLGEYYKTVLISGGTLFAKAAKTHKVSPNILWQQLPALIHVKQVVVKKDPFEKKGIRHILNLGHTVGHVIESKLAIPHGTAVRLGLAFSLEWGARRGLKAKAPDQFLLPNNVLVAALRKIKNPEMVLSNDKKISDNNTIQFIFVKKPGQVFVEKVTMKELVKEWHRQAKA